MVKGMTRRVIVVKAPDPALFDEAIFLVRADAAERGLSDEELLRQANDAAGGYVKAHRTGRRRFLGAIACTVLGALASSAVWLILTCL